MRLFLNVALFYAGWFACVIGMGSKLPALAPAAAVVVVAVHLTLHPLRRAEALVVATVGLVGPILETAISWLDVARFSEPMLFGLYAPPGIIAMWAVFATTFDSSLQWLSTRPWLGAVFAAVGGPLSYAAAERLDAVQLGDGWPLPVAAVWGIGFPLVMRLAILVRRT